MVIHALKLYRFHEVARRKLIRFEELETWRSRRWLLKIIESSSKPDHYLGRARAFFWRALISISSDTYLEKEAEVSFDRFSSSIFLFSFRTNFSFHPFDVLRKESQLSHDHRRLNVWRDTRKRNPPSHKFDSEERIPREHWRSLARSLQVSGLSLSPSLASVSLVPPVCRRRKGKSSGWMTRSPKMTGTRLGGAGGETPISRPHLTQTFGRPAPLPSFFPLRLPICLPVNTRCIQLTRWPAPTPV